MRRIFFFFSLLAFIISNSLTEAQSKYYMKKEPKLGYGVKAGVNISSQSTPHMESDYVLKNIIRFNVGGYCNYFFNKSLAIQPELDISGKGTHWQDYYDNMKDILTYIDIPVLIRYQPIKFLNIEAGPQAGIRVSAVQKDMKTGSHKNINEYYKTFDYGVAFGVEANLPNRVNISVRYVVGIASATTELLYVDPWFNKFLQVSAGFRIKGR
ncbi:MAG: porin family protein [Bacteroidota bacterium]|nr:porin family protein [Bacteroidota bacterium]